MPKRKPFIEKNKGVTFRLTPAVDNKAPIVGNPELVNVVPITDEELTEREKYGIYYADNYNYMSHLKTREELPEFHLVENAKTSAPELPKVATNIIEIKGREIALDFANVPQSSKNAVGNVQMDEEIDPEILEMLNEEEAEDFGDEGELEDDFLEIAGGVDLPEGRRIFEEFRKNAQLSDSDIDDEDLFGDEGQDDAEMLEEKDEAEKPRSILKNTQQPSGNKKEFDEQFNAFYEHMNDSDSECNDEELEDEEELVDEALLENFADDYQDEKEKGKDIKPDQRSKELSLKAYEKQESGRPEETEHIELEVRSKRPKWDCESVTSTYSNIYNHPTVIREAPRRKANLTRKNLRTLDDENDAGEEKMECDTESVRTTRSICSTVRSRGETTDERRERKRAVKEERRERRAEKKTLKEMFKDEKKKTDAQRAVPYVSGRPIP